MIKNLTLLNFRSHEETDLTFSPRVNVIVGRSDNGKSNIIRALNWIAFNRPLGENVIQYDKEEALAQVILEEEGEQVGITRVKGRKGKNEYILSLEEEDVSFKAFGSSPPKPVLEALNFTDLNIQKQSDQYFLVFDSPGQVASYVRTLTKLDDVDKVVKLLGKKIRSGKGNIELYQSELEEVEQELKKISEIDLKSFEEKLEKVRSLSRKIEQYQAEREGLDKLLQELEDIEKKAILLPENIDDILRESDDVYGYYEKLHAEERSLRSILSDLERIQEIKLPKNIGEILEVDGIVQEYNNVRRRKDILLSLLEKLERSFEEVSEVDVSLKGLKKEERKLTESLSVCPYCGAELTEKSREVLLERTIS